MKNKKFEEKQCCYYCKLAFTKQCPLYNSDLTDALWDNFKNSCNEYIKKD